MTTGDKVLNKISGETGIVLQVRVPLMPDCALIQYRPCSDGFCTPRTQLSVVPSAQS